ncbi:hypothetical protein [Promicromonospora soli]
MATSLLQIVVDADAATMPNATALFVDNDVVSMDRAGDFDRMSPRPIERQPLQHR